MEQQKELQKEIREERKLREELADEYDKFREDMGDAAETIEMMTLVRVAYFWSYRECL